MEITRVTVEEVLERMLRGEGFTFVDARNPQAWKEGKNKLSNAIRVPPDEAEKHLDKIPHDRTVITYCTCPNENSGASVAETLLKNGWKNVHPLYGGLDAWKKADAPLEKKEVIDAN